MTAAATEKHGDPNEDVPPPVRPSACFLERVDEPGNDRLLDDVGSVLGDVAPGRLCSRSGERHKGGSRTFEVGGTDVVSYGDLIREYARQMGLRRWLISVPVLTPWLSGLWLALVTPASFEVGRHLIEGLKNPTVVRDRTALDVFPIRPMGTREAIQRAIAEAVGPDPTSDHSLRYLRPRRPGR